MPQQYADHMSATIRFFEPISDRVPFWEIRDEMRTINDLLVALASTKQTIVADLEAEKQRLAQGSEPILVDGIDVRPDTLAEFDSWRIPYARESAESLRNGAGLLLVFAFLERGLRAICEDIEPDTQALKRFLKKDAKKEQGRGTIHGYLSFLQDEKKLEFDLPRRFPSVLRREREFRNMFAHGDWDLHYMVARTGDVMRVFSQLTSLFERIEYALVRQAAA